jgi:hypothetical protein
MADVQRREAEMRNVEGPGASRAAVDISAVDLAAFL